MKLVTIARCPQWSLIGGTCWDLKLAHDDFTLVALGAQYDVELMSKDVDSKDVNNM